MTSSAAALIGVLLTGPLAGQIVERIGTWGANLLAYEAIRALEGEQKLSGIRPSQDVLELVQALRDNY